MPRVSWWALSDSNARPKDQEASKDWKGAYQSTTCNACQTPFAARSGTVILTWAQKRHITYSHPSSHHEFASEKGGGIGALASTDGISTGMGCSAIASDVPGRASNTCPDRAIGSSDARMP